MEKHLGSNHMVSTWEASSSMPLLFEFIFMLIIEVLGDNSFTHLFSIAYLNTYKMIQ